MDIKSKNISYSNGFKVFAIVLLCLSFLTLFGTVIFYFYYQDELTSDTYYETNKFESEFGRLVHNVVEKNVILKDVEYIKESNEDEWVIRNNIERLNTINNKLPELVNFIYFIRNTETGETTTNVGNLNPIDFIEKQSYSVYLDQWQYDDIYYAYDIEQMLENTPYEIYAAIAEPIEESDIFSKDFVNYLKINDFKEIVYILFVVSFIILVTSLIYLVFVAGRKTKDGDINLLFLDKIYIDVHAIIVLILAIVSVLLVIGFFDYMDSGYTTITISFLVLILSIDVLIGLNFILSIVRLIKAGQFIQRSLIYQLYKGLKSLCIKCFNGKIFKAWTLILLLGYGLVNSIIFYILLNTDSLGILIMLIIIIAFNAVVVYFVAKTLQSLHEIMTAAEEIANGNLDYELDITKISIVFKNFGEKILSIQGGMKKAVTEAVKGEHMKTALITNVSHDLKTPLTSIITYVDLLKNEDLKNKKAEEYTDVLEDKSRRLKQLIEDLIEASKASSGNLEVQKEKVDLNELIQQAIGEYEEKFNKAELDVRVNTNENQIFVTADGRYMWRVVENLFSNFVNYSLSKTRVYISIEKKDRYGILTIKNIAAFPLNISSDQLTERFVRGDESRTTEGSGLGLSIAQSLTNLQEGKFNIDIDGDLFKAIVEIPLWD